MKKDLLPLDQASKLRLAFQHAGYTPAQVRTICEGDILAQVRAVLVGKAQIVPKTSSTVPQSEAVQSIIKVLPKMTTTERVTLGQYDRVSEEITDETFPHDPLTVGEWEYKLYYSTSGVSLKNITITASQGGWTVATTEHLLAYGKEFPNVQLQLPVVAAGATCHVNGLRRILALWSHKTRRHFSLRYYHSDWSRPHAFLCVRKIK